MSEENKVSPQMGLTGRKIVYDKDGKPCRTCNTLLDFQFATGKAPNVAAVPKVAAATVATVPATTDAAPSYPQDEPPDVEQLGRSSWTLLHSIAAKYPETPTTKQQADVTQFLRLFSGLYPCWWCGEDFEKYQTANPPTVASQNDLGKWLCDAHNEVNEKIGKPKFDCNLWKQRWRDGWEESK